MNPSERHNDGALEHEHQAHEAFAASRRCGYVPRRSSIRCLDEYVAKQSGMPLVIWGPNGAGKSALVAYWAEQYRKANPGAFIVEHYIDTGVGETGHYGVVRRIILEIKERYCMSKNLPDLPDDPGHMLAPWLWYVQEPMVILIDGLNRLQEESRLLRWLPAHLPPSIRVIVTTSQIDMRDHLAERGWETLEVEPLGPEERQKIVQQFIAERRTELTQEQLHSVAADAGSSNPFLLRSRLEEAHRAVGRDDLNETVKHFLDARDLDELFHWKLLHLEAEHGYQLVRNVTTLLRGTWCGLSEKELEDLTGASRDTLARLMKGLAFYMLQRNGLHTFYSDNLRDAIARRYLSERDEWLALHRRLADYFESIVDPSRWLSAHLPTDTTPVSRRFLSRLAGELAYQLSSAGEWTRLNTTLAPIPIMVALYDGEFRYALLSYWQKLQSRYDIEEVYGESLMRYREAQHSREEMASALDILGIVLQNFGKWRLAEEIYREALGVAEHVGKMGLIARANGSLGRIRAEKGEYREAMRLFRRQMAIARKLSDQRQIAMALGCIGNIHVTWGEYRKAFECYSAKLNIAEELGDKREIAHAVGSMGIVCAEQGEYPSALDYYHKQLNIGEELDEKTQIAQVVGNMGNVYMILGDYPNALACHLRKLDIAQELGNKRQIGIALGNVGLIYYAQGNHSKALDYQKMKLRIAEELGDKRQTAVALGNMGNVHYAQGNYAEALTCYDRRLQMVNEIGDRRQIVTVLGEMGMIYLDQGDCDGALSIYTEMLEIARELEDKSQIFTAIGYMGEVYREQGDYPRALSMFTEALDGHMVVGNKYEITICLCTKASLLVLMATEKGSSEPMDAGERGRLLAEARQLAEMCVTISGDISKGETLFEAKVLLARIDFESGNREHALSELVAMLDHVGDERMRATLKYEFATMSHEMGAGSDAERYARLAEVLYKKIRTRIPRIEYEKRIAVLGKILGY